MADDAVRSGMAMKWTKGTGDVLSAKSGPFALEIFPKGDGRFAWRIFSEGARNPAASGVTGSLAAAKNVTEQFVKRSGLV